ncbi:MAG: acylneuraminate cytidylyltransferase family protein [Candidatus Omnitrophica bacterium]|nr:acylneuraminate cytidylyltransferase family protein [Candidatus Omnitrophota bacterium]
MYRGKKVLALIPARGGSKGLAGKNIRPLCGKPLISWTISEAKKSCYVDRVIVSTDSPEIAAVSEMYHADVPFLRPKRLSGDKAASVDVVLHALDILEKNKEKYDVVILLQPTSPLRKADDINRAVTTLFSKKAKAVVSVTEADHPPLWMNTLASDGNMKGFLSKKHVNVPRQRLPRYFMPNGALFLSFSEHLRKERSFYGNRTYAYVMPRERSVDIDSIFDFMLAETLMKATVVTSVRKKG